MRIFRIELEKLFRRPAYWWSIAAAAVMSVLFGYVIPYLVGEPEPTRTAGGTEDEPGFGVPVEQLFPEELVRNVIGGFPLFYLALALVVGALSSGSEYVWKTVRTMLVQGPRRTVLLAGKLTATVVATLPIAVAAFVAGAAASVVIALVENGPLDPPPLGELLEGVAAAWLILAVGAAIGLAGGVIARGTGPVIGVGLVYLFVVELLLRNFAPSSDAISSIAELLPGTSAGALAGAFTDTDNGAPGVNDLVGSARALITLGVWLVGSAAVAGVVFSRRDVHA